MILMKHPQHGWHNAMSIAEKQTMEKAGWAEHVAAPVALEPAAENETPAGYPPARLKPGPKPKVK